MKIIPIHNTQQIKQLLISANLPTDDIDKHTPAHFFAVKHRSEAVALIGIEYYGEDALLRSLMVKPDYRNQGLASQLIQAIAQEAVQQGVQHLYLLTTTAGHFFSHKGFVTIRRDDTPPTIKATREFSHICPASATIMYRDLNV
ncbi:arsenic resistance N-acetyltransferase ArsN2 [Sedimenticola selenatireducens]|uniref:GNAT family N-acetyltransferase n=1 Tax=Sedimenticola selenatireducens TaxID=191960 RepID=A0A557SHQ8_9GAMM|nr:arsenic resistance N-acetyltransferase ArsN2 [Sedimenticola selenatireducens]TVO76947.1 GNAT family N-acetyltransferase [Sedimenticola selenatireducens]TVT64390.1 MAG: GNAT family N-acetyltransferase [Sedimenticola selenatireducens]